MLPWIFLMFLTSPEGSVKG